MQAAVRMLIDVMRREMHGPQNARSDDIAHLMQAQTRPLKLCIRHKSYLTPVKSCWQLSYGVEDTQPGATGWYCC